jgi:hypothetical protein
VARLLLRGVLFCSLKTLTFSTSAKRMIMVMWLHFLCHVQPGRPRAPVASMRASCGSGALPAWCKTLTPATELQHLAGVQQVGDTVCSFTKGGLQHNVAAASKEPGRDQAQSIPMHAIQKRGSCCLWGL